MAYLRDRGTARLRISSALDLYGAGRLERQAGKQADMQLPAHDRLETAVTRIQRNEYAGAVSSVKSINRIACGQLSSATAPELGTALIAAD